MRYEFFNMRYENFMYELYVPLAGSGRSPCVACAVLYLGALYELYVPLAGSVQLRGRAARHVAAGRGDGVLGAGRLPEGGGEPAGRLQRRL